MILPSGDLTVDNLIQLKEASSRHVIDNIMVRLRDVQISRAALSLSGDLEVRGARGSIPLSLWNAAAVRH